ncbi:hypothetical protein [Virgibacillus sp. L01]
MKIGILYEALQINENTYTFRTEDETFELSTSPAFSRGFTDKIFF